MRLIKFGQPLRPRSFQLRASLLPILWMLPAFAVAESHNVDDIAMFGWLEVDPHFSAQYVLNDQERGSVSSPGTFETRVNWEEELSVMTRSFIYHPGFLNMDIGGGPLFVQQQFDSDQGKNTYNDTLLNFLARLNFLELKTYPFSLYYERSHPSFYTSLAGRFLTEVNEYGFDSRIYDIWDTASLSVELNHRDTVGSGLGTVVDEDADTAAVSFVANYRDSDSLDINHTHTDRDSASGNAGSPIGNSTIIQDNSEIRSVNKFGKRKQIEIHHFLRRLQQEIDSATFSEVDNRSYFGSLRWRHSEVMRSFLNYRFADTARQGADSNSKKYELGFVRNPNERLSFSAGIDQEALEQTGFSRDNIGADGSVSYARETSFGRVNLSGSLQANRVDQTSSADLINVFDEAIILNGTTPVSLANEFVVASTVVISNAPRTQIYVEGFDYRLIINGSVTSVQRLIGGRISDGETVLADYSYETAGTAKYDVFGSGAAVSVDFLKFMNAYVRYDRRDSNIRSGELTNPLNDRNGLQFGIGTSGQFLGSWMLDAEYRHVDQDEVISPFVSDAFDAGLTTSLRGTLKLTVAGSVTQIDYDYSPEDVDQVTYRIGLAGRLFRRGQFSYDASYLDDVGGTLPRRQLQHRLNYQWAFRQVRFTLRAMHSEEELGDTTRSSTQVMAQVSRAF